MSATWFKLFFFFKHYQHIGHACVLSRASTQNLLQGCGGHAGANLPTCLYAALYSTTITASIMSAATIFK